MMSGAGVRMSFGNKRLLSKAYNFILSISLALTVVKRLRFSHEVYNDIKLSS